MTKEQAINVVSEYLAHRMEARKVLLAAARERFPKVTNAETRKLHRFSSDLTDQRLLDLVIAHDEDQKDANRPLTADEAKRMFAAKDSVS